MPGRVPGVLGGDNVPAVYDRGIADAQNFLTTWKPLRDPEWRVSRHFPNVQKAVFGGICGAGVTPVAELAVASKEELRDVATDNASPSMISPQR